MISDGFQDIDMVCPFLILTLMEEKLNIEQIIILSKLNKRNIDLFDHKNN